MSDPKPCPFCGVALKYNEHRAIASKEHPLMQYYLHERTRCILDWYEVYPEDIPLWNRRENDE